MILKHGEKRLARKVHSCAWCGLDIEPGERYFASSGMSEGEFYSAPMHHGCYQVWAQNDFGEFYFYDMPPAEPLRDPISEHRLERMRLEACGQLRLVA